MADLEAVKHEQCPAGAKIQLNGGQPASLSKGEMLQQVLTGALPGMSAHCFELQRNYLVCRECKSRILRHAAREKLEALARTPCWNGPWMAQEGWNGHGTHELWRQGGKVSCKRCMANALSKAGNFSPSKVLMKPCGKAEHTTLPALFRSQNG